MAESDKDQKQFEPTQQRLDQAREKGQIAYSTELIQGAMLLTGAVMLWFGSGLGDGMRTAMSSGLRDLRTDLTVADMPVLVLELTLQFGTTIGALLAVLFVMAAFLGFMQTGGGIASEALEPQWNRLSPMKGLQKIFSSRSIVRALLSFLKILGVLGITYWVASGKISLFLSAGGMRLSESTGHAWDTTVAVAMAVAGAMTLLGAGDFLYQRWKHNDDLKMTQQEMKEEHKQQAGDPMIKARLRKLQRERANARMIQDVPEATVVVTNPTHFAVALKYDRTTMTAPKVVAKGVDAFALRIRRVAEENDVPILERKPIARALYATVEVGDEIPAELYHAVAEILSAVLDIGRRNAA